MAHDKHRFMVKCERLSPTTFHSWTDGPKLVIEIKEGQAVNNTVYGNVDHMFCSKDEVIQALKDNHSPFGTYYVIGEFEVFLDLVEKFPMRDFVYLLVNKDEH